MSSEPQAQVEADTPAVEDVNDLVQKRKLNDIIDAQNTAWKRIDEATELKEFGEIDEARANNIIHNAVVIYLSKLRQPALRTDIGQQFWYEEQIGEIPFNLPSPEAVAWQHKRANAPDNWSPRDTTGMPDGYELITIRANDASQELVGLGEYYELEPPITRTHQFVFDIRYKGQVSVEIPHQQNVPKKLSRDALDLANEMASELDLAPRLTRNAEEAIGDYTFENRDNIPD